MDEFASYSYLLTRILVYMPSYEFTQRMMATTFGSRELLGGRHVFAGAVAGLCGSVVKVPMDVVKKRLQAGLYSNINVAVRSIANEGVGFLGKGRMFYTGWRSAILYDVPYNAVQFTVLENVKKIYRKKDKKGFDNVLVGAFTGVVTSLLTEPLDVVKTRMMTQRMTGVGAYKGWWDCVYRIAKEEGVRSLWKGTLPRLVWVAASSAVWYGTYQTARQNLGKRRIESTAAQEKLRPD